MPQLQSGCSEKRTNNKGEVNAIPVIVYRDFDDNDIDTDSMEVNYSKGKMRYLYDNSFVVITIAERRRSDTNPVLNNPKLEVEEV